MATNEIFIGKNTTTDETIGELSDIIDIEKPDSLILLGEITSAKIVSLDGAILGDESNIKQVL